MKKITLTLVAVLATLCVIAQTKFWVYTNDGNAVDFDIANTDSISFTQPPYLGKCKASDYDTVIINGVVWMKENYACRKYDTEAVAVMEAESD